MKLAEKIDLLQSTHFPEWFDMRKKVDEELSLKQGMWCVCGRLATGMHERYCKRFNNKVSSETAKRLKALLPNHPAPQEGEDK